MKNIYVLCVLFIIVISLSACVTQKDTDTQCRECPQFAPPHPDWCRGGTIIPGDKDECGCQMPPKCEEKS
ncbi:MAG: hypothetical protein AMQ22_01689 [Candidatus Methanofastidiosum methylothiophilum]|uniref:Lipoprotein n=1 Tax=Candidatus Methanofastidiosum methylothiophilum TaxID=1705564 RepID=A0A150IW64_9EURY|nr:MAG: hypothetical protein AMQ22_01689 [Candidatus Methanofastidiosum methylthiophilus]